MDETYKTRGECLRKDFQDVVEKVRECLIRLDVSPDEKSNFRYELARVMQTTFFEEYEGSD